MLMRQDHFTQSKCDRCGKTTPAKQNGIGDLYALPHEYVEPLSDSGDFCAACCGRYDEADWLVWFKTHRPEDFEQEATMKLTQITVSYGETQSLPE